MVLWSWFYWLSPSKIFRGYFRPSSLDIHSFILIHFKIADRYIFTISNVCSHLSVRTLIFRYIFVRVVVLVFFMCKNKYWSKWNIYLFTLYTMYTYAHWQSRRRKRRIVLFVYVLKYIFDRTLAIRYYIRHWPCIIIFLNLYRSQKFVFERLLVSLSTYPFYILTIFVEVLDFNNFYRKYHHVDFLFSSKKPVPWYCFK